MKPNSNLNHFQQLLFHTISPPLHQYNLFWSYKKRAPKLLVGRQNWVTWRGGRQNIVPGLTTERRPPARSVIYINVGDQRNNNKNLKGFKVGNLLFVKSWVIDERADQ